MPPFCLKQNVNINFEYILSFKTFLSKTAKYLTTKRKAAKRLKEKRRRGERHGLTGRLKTMDIKRDARHRLRTRGGKWLGKENAPE